MSIQTDDNTAGLSEADAEAALFESLGGAPEGDDTNDDEGDDDQDADEGDDDLSGADDDDDQDPGADDDAGDDDADEGDDGSKTTTNEAADDHIVKVTLDGETKEFTVGTLKRLAGQEASLTRKSQEADLVGGRAAAALQAALSVAQEDLAPYQGVDWMVLQQEMDPGEFKWHRENAQRLDARFRKLVGAAEGFEKDLSDRRQAASAEMAAEALREMTADVPGWDDKADAAVRAFGVSQGLDPNDVKGISNAKVLKILRKAMLYDQGQKVATQKVKDAPNKVLRGTNRAQAAKGINVRKAERALKTTGSDDAAVAVLMGRWG